MPSSPASTRSFLREPRHVVAALRLLVFAALAVLGWTEPPTLPLIYWSVTVVYGLTVAGYLTAHNGSLRLRRVRAAIFLFDVAVVSALLVLRGRDVQPLLMGYFTVVLLAALLAGLGRPLWNAVIGTAIYTVVMGWGRPPAELLELSLLGPAFFFFVIAVFMGHVAEASGARAHTALLPPALLRMSTARLRATRDVLRSEERLRTVEMLCAGVAHELRRPIAALLECTKDGAGLLATLANGEDAAAIGELRAVFDDLGHEAARLGQVAGGLGELGRGGTERQTAVSTADMVASAQRILERAAEDHKIPLRTEVACDRAVLGDPARLTQVLVILAGNALDAVRAAGGGHVTLRVRDAAPEAGASPTSVCFEVHDDGPGIQADVRERMYDPFYTTKGPGRGTGLGLYVGREIARALGGELACTSVAGKGTTFVLELPATAHAGASEAA
jgi:signal transduction histidine kinase